MSDFSWAIVRDKSIPPSISKASISSLSESGKKDIIHVYMQEVPTLKENIKIMAYTDGVSVG